MKLNFVWLAVVALLVSGKWKRWCTNWEGWKQLNLSPFVQNALSIALCIADTKTVKPHYGNSPLCPLRIALFIAPILTIHSKQKQFTEIHQNTQQCTKGQTKIHQDTNVLHSAIQNVQWLCDSEWWMLRTHIALQKAKSFNKELFLTTNQSAIEEWAHKLCHSREW